MPVRDLLSAASGASAAATYIEDVFSTYLYTGTGATQSINNGINLSTKGGLTWIKSRSDATNNNLFNTIQGATKLLHSNTTDSLVTNTVSLTAFNSTGFTLGTGSGTGNEVNVSASTYCSWSFAKQAKFFDVVTWAGDGTNGRAISHSLTSTPGMILVKCTNTSTNWTVWQRSAEISGGGAGNANAQLNLTNAFAQDNGDFWGNRGTATYIAPTSTNFTVSDLQNQSGRTFVAYLFAHNAGGFGTTGSDNVISCGLLSAPSSAFYSITLGYEPQYVLVKKTDGTGNWIIGDVMRGASNTNYFGLQANSSNAEQNFGAAAIIPTATGFTFDSNQFGTGNFIYMAIRRPMKVPTDATTVYNAISRAGTGATATITTGNRPDLVIAEDLLGLVSGVIPWFDRLRGVNYNLGSSQTALETNRTDSLTAFNNTTFVVGTDTDNVINGAGTTWINWALTRAPGFFDEVCYTGNGTTNSQTHNLGVVPELVIVKSRSTAGVWIVNGNFTPTTQYYASLNNATAGSTATYAACGVFSGIPTLTTLPFNNAGGSSNASGTTYVAYLFATCPGVSKVGSYTGTGATQTINCGFTGGARFVLIKRTDSTGDWYVWDTARGMVSGTDPSIRWNSNGSGQVNANSVYTATTGFQIVSTAAGINASGGSYIFLAIA